MNHRTGRRPSSRHQAESYIIDPHAARLNGGNLPGQVRQGHWPVSGGAAPRPRQPNHAGGIRQEGGFENSHEIEESETRRELRNILLSISTPVRGRSDGFIGEHHNLEGGRLDTHHHRQPRGSLHDRSNAYNTRPSHHDHARASRPSGFGEEMSPFEAAGTHPGRHGPTGRRHRDAPNRGDPHQNVERHADPQLRRAHSHRDQSENPRRDPNARSSRTSGGARSTHQVHGPTPRQQIGRFIPYTFPMLRARDVDFLTRLFRVRASDVKRWCERDYILMDRSRDRETNIDRLLSTLSSTDRETYARAYRRMEAEKGVGELVGWGPRTVPAEYEFGFDEGLAGCLPP